MHLQSPETCCCRCTPGSTARLSRVGIIRFKTPATERRAGKGPQFCMSCKGEAACSVGLPTPWHTNILSTLRPWSSSLAACSKATATAEVLEQGDTSAGMGRQATPTGYTLWAIRGRSQRRKNGTVKHEKPTQQTRDQKNLIAVTNPNAVARVLS